MAVVVQLCLTQSQPCPPREPSEIPRTPLTDVGLGCIRNQLLLCCNFCSVFAKGQENVATPAARASLRAQPSSQPGQQHLIASDCI